MRGNSIMAGYHGQDATTDEAFRDGWFHSGDLAVWHPDGYVELRDRSKDIIISEFVELPRTSTGKVQKFVLREREWEGQERSIG